MTTLVSEPPKENARLGSELDAQDDEPLSKMHASSASVAARSGSATPAKSAKSRGKAAKEKQPAPDQDRITEYSADYLAKHFEKSRRLIPFDKLMWDEERKYGQCRKLQKSLYEKYYTDLMAKGPPLQPWAGGLAWMMDGVSLPKKDL